MADEPRSSTAAASRVHDLAYFRRNSYWG